MSILKTSHKNQNPIVWIALFAFLTSPCAFADHHQTTEQAVTQLENDLSAAFARGDAAMVEKHLAGTYIFTDPAGAMMNKAQILADLQSGDLKIESSTYDDMKVQVYGDTAVATYRSTDKGSYKGQDISGQYRWTDVLVKMDGQWKIVATQGTPIAPSH